MKLGVHTAILHDRPLPQALEVIASLGLGPAEINAGVALAGPNANGDPLHPDPVIGEAHAADLRRAIRAAGALGQTRVVTMSGQPGGEPGSTVPNWIVNAWPEGSAWDFVALGQGHDVDFWTRFVSALRAVDPEIAINTEHEDTAFGAVEGLTVAAEVLKAAAAAAV